MWDYAGEMTLLRAFWDAAREVDPERAAAADEGVVMRWCGEGELAELWRAAGLRDVRFGPLVVSASYTDFEDLWSPFPTGSRRPARSASRSTTTTVPRCTTPTGAGSGVGDDPFELTARAWAVAGTVG